MGPQPQERGNWKSFKGLGGGGAPQAGSQGGGKQEKLNFEFPSRK